MYPEQLVSPMREELTSLGIEELKTAKEVQSVFKENQGTKLVVINSVCGCAAGFARPGVKLALSHSKLPDQLYTVFAGQDKEATEKVRQYITNYPPSSPSIALFKEGKLSFMMPRHQIEGRMPEQIAKDLIQAFDTYC